MGSSALHQVLYLSRLAPGIGPGVVKDIARAARKHNPAHGVTGALLFDGERFCQLVEGGEAEVGALIARIARDPRHIWLRTLHSGAQPGPRVLSGWRSGYCSSSADFDAFAVAEPPAGEAALRLFVALVQSADLD